MCPWGCGPEVEGGDPVSNEVDSLECAHCSEKTGCSSRSNYVIIRGEVSAKRRFDFQLYSLLRWVYVI